MKQVSVNFEDHQQAVIRELATANKRSFSNMAILLIEEALLHREKKEKK